MMRLLALLGPLRSIGALLAVLAALWGGYQWIRYDAYQDGKSAAEAVCLLEKQEQAEANQNAARRAYDQLRNAAAILDEKDKELADAQERINAAADADPGGNAGGIGVDSVQRLNTIR